MRNRVSVLWVALPAFALCGCDGRAGGSQAPTEITDRFTNASTASVDVVKPCAGLDPRVRAKTLKATHVAIYDREGIVLSERSLREDYIVQQHPSGVEDSVAYLQRPGTTGCPPGTYRMCDGSCTAADRPGSVRALDGPGPEPPGESVVVQVHTIGQVLPAETVSGVCPLNPAKVAAAAGNSQINDPFGGERAANGSYNGKIHLVEKENGDIVPMGLRATGNRSPAVATTILVREVWCWK